MKQLFLTLIIVAISLVHVNGQQVPNAKVYQIPDYSLYFLADSVTGKYYVYLDYDRVYPLEEGIALVEKNGMMGAIDNSGKMIIPMDFDIIRSFVNGYAIARKGGFEFLINKSGKSIGSETKYTECWSVNDGMAKVYDGSKYGYIDITGKEVIAPKFDEAFSFSEGLARVRIDTLNMFINKSGVRVGTGNFKAAGDFSDGLGLVKSNGLYGFINKSGAVVVPIQYSNAESFSKKIARVEKKIDLKTSVGFVNAGGKEIIPCSFDHGMLRNDGFVIVDTGGYVMYNSFSGEYELLWAQYGIFNTSGQQIVPLMYNEISEFTGDFALVSKNGEIKLINKSGKEISGPINNANVVNNLAIIQDTTGKMSIMNNQGVVISTHDFILSYPDSSFIANDGGVIGDDNKIQGGKCGLMSKTGTSLSEVKYDIIMVSKNGFHIVTMNNKVGFINRSGKEIVSPKYAVAYDFSEGMALVNDSAYYNEDYGWVGGHWGYIDQTGKEVIPMIYDEAEPFYDGLALVEKDKQKMFVDKTGKEVLKLNFENASGFSNGVAVVVKSYKFGAIDKSGNLVIPLIYDGYIGSFDKWHLFKQGKDVLLIDITGQVVKKL